MRTIQHQEAEENCEDDNKDISQLISQARKSLRKTLTVVAFKCHKDADLEYLVRITHALINSNNEIWGRCKDNLHHKNKQCNQLSDEAALEFNRVGFHVVEVLPHSNGGKEIIVFHTHCSMQSKTFSVPRFPHLLSTFVPATMNKNGMLNYSQYFQQSFALEESILLPFLANLKDHLESFQVFLGDVESWLLGSSRSAIFIQDTFAVKVEVQEIKHAKTYRCIHCGDPAHSHKRGKKMSSFRWSLICNGVDFEGHACEGSFVKKSVTVLDIIESSDDFNLSFDISSINGQERLKKFLAFVRHSASDVE